MYSAYNLAKSFYFAFSGIIWSIGHERNLRIHFFTAAYVLYFSHYFTLSKAEYCVLVLSMGLVITCELINTAIEAAVDLNTLAYNDLAKIAKDAAAGAVLVSAFASLIIGIALFWQPEVLDVIWSDITAKPFIWLFLFAITVFLVAWPEYRQTISLTSKNNNITNNVKENK